MRPKLGSDGPDLSSAVNLFLTRVAHDRAIPFDIRVPNAITRAAMAEADEIASRHSHGGEHG